MSLTVLQASDRRPARWRNGGGTTQEVLSRQTWFGPGFDWRISLAEVRAGGRFSAFPDVDRVLVLVAGSPLVLTVDGARHEVRQHQPFGFDGAAQTTCELRAGVALA
jgi:environmental stress-induced protein Ves